MPGDTLSNGLQRHLSTLLELRGLHTTSNLVKDSLAAGVNIEETSNIVDL